MSSAVQMTKSSRHDFFDIRHSIIYGHRSSIPEHFFDSSVAGVDAAQAILAQRDHSKLNCFLFYCDRWRAFIHQLTHWISNLQKLVNSFSSFVARIVAGVAAFAVKELFVANIRPGNPQFRQEGIAGLIRRAALPTDAAQ